MFYDEIERIFMLTEDEFRWRYLLNKDELQAVKDRRRMTQELFDRIVKKTLGRGIGDSFSEFLIKYQDYLLKYCEKYRDLEVIYLLEYDELGQELDEKWEIYKEKHYIDPYLK